VCLSVREQHGGAWRDVSWRFRDNDELSRYLAHGALLELDARSGAVRARVVSLRDVRPGAAYMFQPAGQETASETASAAVAAVEEAEPLPPPGLARASTAAILAHAAVLDAVGPLRAFNSGAPFTFHLTANNADANASFRVDGVLLTKRCARATGMVLANFVHAAPREAHVGAIVARCEALKRFLRGTAPDRAPDDKFPKGLGAHCWARVVPFLSAPHARFAPALQGAAMDAGVLPLLCSGIGADAVCVLAPGAQELLDALR
jgi:hypothetical protein